MADRQHPDIPGALVCVLTGEPAHAVVAGRVVSGWYGSTVVDLDDRLVARPDALPEGPVSDGVLRRALAAGQVFDPEGIVLGTVRLANVPDDVVEALVAHGARGALASLDAGDGQGTGLHVPPVRRVGEDDPLTIAPAAALFGRPRGPGVDLEALGALAALALRARGRPVDPWAIGADVVARIGARDAMLGMLADGLRPGG